MPKNPFKKILPIIFVVLLVFNCSALVYAEKNSQKQNKTSATKSKTPGTTSKKITPKIIPIINLDVLGVYSKIQGHNGIGGALVNGLISPVVKLNNRNYIIPLYNINYKRELQVIFEEEGGWLTMETLSHNVYLTYKNVLTKKLTAKVSGLGTWAFCKETSDEKWGKGLYDYTDAGGMLDIEYTLSEPKAKIHRGLGFEVEGYRRKYPNFESLISLATPTAPEVHEKDYDGIKFTLNLLEQDPDSLSFDVGYQPLLKYFIDKLVVGSDGVLTSGRKRKDNQHTGNFKINYPFSKKLRFGLDYQMIFNNSNQNFYDSQNTIILSDDVFTKHYYSYKSFEITPKIAYDIPLKKEKNLTVHINYSYLDRRYCDRKAQKSNGVYTNNREKDKYHTFGAGFSYPLTSKIKALCLFNYTQAKSNMKYEEYYQYNYDLMSIACGISCRF